MKELKNEFTFQYQNKTIQVRLCGEVYCAIFEVKGQEVARPLIIDVYDDTKINKGKITLRDNEKFLSWLPSYALKEHEHENRPSHSTLIKQHNLDKFCEICLNTNKTELEVHHVKELAITKNNDKKNLRVYCSSCHSLVHRIRTIKIRAIKEFTDLTVQEIKEKLNELK